MTISIIIPTFNEAASIEKLIRYISAHSRGTVIDLIVSDGGSSDDTISLANRAGARAVFSPRKGRAAQMNYGASLSKGRLLYFVHADCLPPHSFVDDILAAVKKGYRLGRYRTKFDSDKWILKINAWFTRFDFFICMGGDQTLFIETSLFKEYKGFSEEMKIMEEYEFCERVRKMAKYKILNGDVLVSARKYDENTWLRVQVANARMVRMYKKGVSQEEMVDTYRRLLNLSLIHI